MEGRRMEKLMERFVGPYKVNITNGYLLVCDLQEWSSKGSKIRSSLATKDVVKSEV